ncbi:MAG: hypothetical protein JXR71_12290 [Bacteroidales bacterium]|nr:hypothetical protein [Bacteroidales bacterium]
MTSAKKHSTPKFTSPFGNLKPADFNRLSQFIYTEFGIHLPEKKLYLVQNRLTKRLRELNMESYTEYADYVLQGNKEEVLKMIEVISTNKTDFFREQRHFDFLSEVIPEKWKGENLKLWSAGCSSGQEVYSLAMLLENFRERNIIGDYQVCGTDVSARVLEQAQLAVYPYKYAEDIPEPYRKKYLLKSKDQTHSKIRIAPNIRKKTCFTWMNLATGMYNFPEDFHMIFCRNTLIYFDLTVQQKVVNGLLEHLLPGGYLFVGHSEALINMNIKGLKLISPSVYQKIEYHE